MSEDRIFIREVGACKCGCGDSLVKCGTCGYISGFRHRWNHVCIMEVKVFGGEQ